MWSPDQRSAANRGAWAGRRAASFFPEGTLRRLRALKREIDPTDVFRSNHPVTAAA